ncbi:Sugar fermentation stimulation protein A [bacterium HR40]|nr:Sugar fermentation stimulation protein A [bacterium HR40]
MRLPQPLYPGRLVRRYRRFLVDVELEGGRQVTAHCADPGRLPGLAVPGARVWLSLCDHPGRRLPFTLELVEQDGTLVAVNSRNPNRLAREGFAAGRIGFARGVEKLRGEPAIGPGTRLDFVLRHPAGHLLFVEVKGVTWKRAGLAQFPDAPTRRGRRHLATLTELARSGQRAALLLIAQRGDVDGFRPAADIDPAWAEAFAEARAAGVEIEAWRCAINLESINLDRTIPLV